MIDFHRLFEEHGARLVELAASVVGTRVDAEDVVQEAFVKAYRSRDAFRGDANPGTWLRRIVMNEALDFRRRRHARGGAAVVEAPDERPARGPGPDTTASELERAEAVRRAIDTLPQDQRTVVILREIEGLAYREIAEQLGLPLGTVESRVLRARERLRATLRKHLVEDPEPESKGRPTP
jgi:RNA polymerase sigma-70 factor (ECF subfamily)